MKETQILHFIIVTLMQLHRDVCFNGLPSIRNAQMGRLSVWGP